VQFSQPTAENQRSVGRDFMILIKIDQTTVFIHNFIHDKKYRHLSDLRHAKGNTA
jgi:hypothetical protein